MSHDAASRDQSLSLDALERIDRVCAAFEAACKAGKRPDIEANLTGVTGRERRVLLRELLLLELHYRQSSGDAFTPAEYCDRFPNDSEFVSSVLVNRASCCGPRTARDDAPRVALARGAAAPAAAASKPASPADTTGSSSLPVQFGRYRILQKLGRGGMGNVHLAFDTALRRNVALKIPRFAASDGPEALERFLREARAAATIDHPNICPIYDVGQVDGVHFMAMAYLEGQPLSDFVRGQHAVPQRQVAAVVRKLALALAEAHACGVIHRDLKPSNIMVSKRRDLVIVDFGLARVVSHQDENVDPITEYGRILGTPSYMPPEQLEGKIDEVGPRSDIYSLGIVMYELLTGRLPFQGAFAVLASQIMTQAPPPPTTIRPDLDPALERICLRAISKRAEDRHRSMTELARELGDYLRGVARRPNSPAPSASADAPTGAKASVQVVGDENLAQLFQKLDSENTGTRLATLRQRPQSLSLLWSAVAVLLFGLGVLRFAEIKTLLMSLIVNGPSTPANPQPKPEDDAPRDLPPENPPRKNAPTIEPPPDGSSAGQPPKVPTLIPVLIKPAEGATLPNGGNGHTNWSFGWQRIANATAYHLSIKSPKGQFEKTFHTTATLAEIETPTVDVAELKGWKWRVQAQIDGDWQQWSETQTFDVAPRDGSMPPIAGAGPLAPAPELLEPAESAVLDNGRTDAKHWRIWEFHWSGVPNSTSYELSVVNKDAQFPLVTAIVQETKFRSISTGYSLSTSGWTWRVRARVNGRWGIWSEPRAFRLRPVDSSPPGNLSVPQLLEPAKGAVLDNGRKDGKHHRTWMFEWTPVAGASEYELDVAGQKKGRFDIHEVLKVAQFRRVFEEPVLQQSGWTWKVRAKLNGRWGAWSEPRRFGVQPVDSAPPDDAG